MKIVIKKEECFSSYLQRLAQKYYANNHDIWRKITREGAHYPQAQISKSIDVTPHTIFDLDKTEELLNLTRNQVYSASLCKVYKLFSIPMNKMAHNNLLIKCINPWRNYCPICLQEEENYKLIWQVREMNFCDIHYIKLYDRCWYCNKHISILPANSQFAICPYCYSKLSLAPIQKIELELSIAKRIVTDWKYLLNPDIEKFKPIDGKNVAQTIAIKQMHISDDLRNAYFLQKARDTLHYEFSLNCLLPIIRRYNVSLKEFFELQVPNQLVNDIISPKKMSLENYSCLSPWCMNYKQNGKSMIHMIYLMYMY